jgi:hypothetical protein
MQIANLKANKKRLEYIENIKDKDLRNEMRKQEIIIQI